MSWPYLNGNWDLGAHYHGRDEEIAHAEHQDLKIIAPGCDDCAEEMCEKCLGKKYLSTGEECDCNDGRKF